MKRLLVGVFTSVALLVAGWTGASARSLSALRTDTSALPNGGIVAGVPGFIKVAKLIGPAPPLQVIHLAVHLPYPDPAGVAAFVATVNDPSSPMYGKFLTPSQFAQNFGPTPHSYTHVEYVLTSFGLGLITTYANQKVLDVTSTVAVAELLFGTTINQYNYKNVIYYANAKPAKLPLLLNGLVMAVTGFTNFAVKVAQPPSLMSGVGFGPDAIETAYNEPLHVNRKLDGTGVTIAVATAYDYADSDVQAFWNAYNIKRTGKLSRVIVKDPAGPGPPPPALPDETTLDTEQTTSNAPGANVVVYEGVDSTSATFDDVYEAIVVDPNVDVVTTSFGSCEPGSDPKQVEADNDLFEEGAAEGQTWFAASGDYGSHDCSTNSPPLGFPGYPNPNTVDFPASSPVVAAAGGTTLTLKANHTIASEKAWSGSGGGYSSFFTRPKYQDLVTTLANRRARNVPDVALNADPNTPYAMAYLGTFLMSVGGTSPVAPNLAAIYAQIDQYYGRRLGLAQAGLYNGFVQHAYPGTAWHDIDKGGNGRFKAGKGYDNVTGTGSLDAYRYMLQIPLTRANTRL